MININKPSEGLDYVIEPLDNTDNTQAWMVSLKTGTYKGSSLLFTRVEYNGKRGNLRFQLDGVDANKEILDPTPAVQDYAFEILQDIIRNGIANGSIVLDDKDSDYGSVERERAV